MKRAHLSFLSMAMMLISALASGQTWTGFRVPSDDEIRADLIKRLGKRSDRVGIVVGIIEPSGRRIVAYGSFGKDAGRQVDGDTVFEIGSVTKVFTSLLLADMSQRGEVALTDPVAKYLPAGVKIPKRGGVISLEDLARHRSGLPRLPSNATEGSDPVNPYANYSVSQLYRFLSNYELPRDVGEEFEYSNLGMGLLGHVLALAAGRDYETLVLTRICRPLGMHSTGIELSAEMKSSLATGHNNRFQPTNNWDIPTLAGGGALRSTANDMLSFIEAQIGYRKSGLDSAIAETRAKRTPTRPGMLMGLGWMIRPKKGSEIVWHNGGTGGYRSFVGFDPKAGVGVVVLTNIYPATGIDDLGFRLLSGSPKKHRKIKLDTSLLDLYVGKYQFTPRTFLTISRSGNSLFAQITGDRAYEMYPEAKTDFFLENVDCQIVFKIDSEGRVNGVVVRQFGTEQFAGRLEAGAETLQEWFGHREKRVDSKLFDNYVGSYRLPIGTVFTVTRGGDHLYIEETGRQKTEIFAENERIFFVKSYDALITFETDGAGPAKALRILQNGRELRGTRIPE